MNKRSMYRVVANKSVRYKSTDDESVEIRPRTFLTLTGGDAIPDDASDEQVREWVRGGFVVEDAKAKTSGRLRNALKSAESPFDREVQPEGEDGPIGKLGLGSSDDPTKRQMQGDQRATQKAQADQRMKTKGIWHLNPAQLKGLSLEKLQVRVAEILAQHANLEGTEIPNTVEGCIALLSSDYVAGIQ